MSLFPSGRRNPFWSAIIPQVAGTVTIAGLTSASLNIQPPVGETWLVHIDTFIDGLDANQIVDYRDYDGTTLRPHIREERDAGYSRFLSKLSVLKVLTNSLYANIYWYNDSTASTVACYGYSGFKLSEPLWKPEKLISNPEPKPYKRPLTTSFPEEIKTLEAYGVEFWDEFLGKYVPSIILEEDLVLTVEPVTKFPVERLTSYITVENLMNILHQRDVPSIRPDVKLEAPPKFRNRKMRELNKEEFEEVTGHKKYFQRWREEGIKI